MVKKRTSELKDKIEKIIQNAAQNVRDGDYNRDTEQYQR